MGYFNQITEKSKPTVIKRKQLYLTCGMENDTLSGLFQWVCDKDKSYGFIIDGNNIKTLHNCTLIIIVDAIKQHKGKTELTLTQNNKVIHKYIEDTDKKNTLIRVTYSGKFIKNDIISVDFLNVKNIQITIYGHII